MIQVLERAFAVLEQVADSPDREHSISELAQGLGVRPSTCSNIVRSLVEFGYLETAGPRRGYRLGPAPGLLARRAPYARNLIDVATGELEALSRSLEETCLLSVLRGMRRHVLLHVRHDAPLQIRSDVLLLENPYLSPSGRLLVALLSPRERDRLAERLGTPGDAWPEGRTKAELEKVCESIRRTGQSILSPSDPDGLAGVAFPVRYGEGYAALGVYLPRYRFRGEHKRVVLKSMKETSLRIGAQAERLS